MLPDDAEHPATRGHDGRRRQLRLLAVPAVVVGRRAVARVRRRRTSGRAPTWAGWRDYLDAIDAARPAVNVATLVGHGSVRREVARRRRGGRPTAARARSDARDRCATRVLDGRGRAVDRADLRPGDLRGHRRGRSRSRAPPRARAACTPRTSAARAATCSDAVDEALAIGAAAELPVHVSHLKCETSLVWGRADELLAPAPGRAGRHRRPVPLRGVELVAVVAAAALGAGRGGRRARGERPRPAARRGRTRRAGLPVLGRRASGGTGSCSRRRRSPGGVDAPSPRSRTDRGVEPFDAMIELLAADPEISCIGHAMSRGRRAHDPVRSRGLRRVRRLGDGARRSAAATCPCTRATTARSPVRSALARDEGLLPVEAVVRKMTSLPADRFGLTGRGRIEPGAFADLVVFDPATIRDTATYERPTRSPRGSPRSWSTASWRGPHADGEIVRAGRALRRG